VEPKRSGQSSGEGPGGEALVGVHVQSSGEGPGGEALVGVQGAKPWWGSMCKALGSWRIPANK
jgi:hypothetical protein